MNIHVFSGDDVAAVLSMKAAIDLMRHAFVQLSAGEAHVPLRTRIDAEKTGCRVLIMPGHLPRNSSVGLKIVSIQDRNPARSLPSIQGLMMVIDDDTGEPVAMMDAERLTAIRTGAASGLATDLLALANSSVAAIFGSGPQAETQLEAIAEVRNLDVAYVYSRRPESAEKFAERMSSRLNIRVVRADSPAELRNADIICTATTSTDPVFDANNIKPGAHVNAIGSFSPDTIEVPRELVARAIVVVDQRDACLQEAGELVQTIQAGLMQAGDVRTELGEIAAGKAKGRLSPSDITLFKSVGNAVQDVAAASYVLKNAADQNLGTIVTL
jgi:ornithine cyclodeaminase/alanine dehydrogenase-like protein (mu-crystallin family)